MSVRPVGRAKSERGATELLARHGIRSAPVDPEEIARLEGIRVFYEHLPRDTSSVLLREPSGTRIICVNSVHSEVRRRFSVAHEIGHAALHFSRTAPAISEAAVSRPLEVLFRDGLAGAGTDRIEIDANTFAAALLMPESLVTAALREQLGKTSSPRKGALVRNLSEGFAVSEQAMGYRLINLGLIDPV